MSAQTPVDITTARRLGFIYKLVYYPEEYYTDTPDGNGIPVYYDPEGMLGSVNSILIVFFGLQGTGKYFVVGRVKMIFYGILDPRIRYT